jgi:hypothetical protein
MSVYIISYDLLTPGQDYKKLFNALETYPAYWHILESTWIIKSSQSSRDICDDLAKHIDTNDRLVVLKLSSEGAWIGLSDKGTEWLKNVLS